MPQKQLLSDSEKAVLVNRLAEGANVMYSHVFLLGDPGALPCYFWSRIRLLRPTRRATQD